MSKVAKKLDLAMLAAKADAFKEMRDRRLEAKRAMEALQEEERVLRDDLVDYLTKAKKEGVHGITGRLCQVSLIPKRDVFVEDWDALYTHIMETGEFELMQRRVGERAVKERWDMGEVVPGVVEHEGVDLSVRKP